MVGITETKQQLLLSFERTEKGQKPSKHLRAFEYQSNKSEDMQTARD